MKQKKFIFKSWSSSLIIVALISLIIGALAGTISGFYASSLLTSTEGSFLYPLLQQKILHQFQDKTTDTEKKLSTPILNEGQIVAQVVEKVNPSVVSIVVTKYVTQYYGLQQSPFDDFFNSPFFEFNLPNVPAPEQERQKKEVGGGTGFVISSKKGLILTNKHVVSDEEAEYTVVTNDGEKYKAEVLARDPFNDIAILKIATDKLPEIQLGDSDQLKVGETVIAIGNALGEYRNTVTKGVISGISRRVIASGAGGSEVLEGVIQTDAAINFGNSGGPLINIQGEVIGINTAISRQGQLIGFAIPSNQAKQVVESVEKYGKIVRPFLGIRYVIINQEMAKVNKLPVDYGALIVRGQTRIELAVIPGSPANKAGLVEGDIILEMNEQKITEKTSLAKEIQKYQPGDEVKLKIYHQGEEKIIKVVLEEYSE